MIKYSFFFILLLNAGSLFGQISIEEIEIIKCIKDYKNILTKELCFDKANIKSDSDSYLIIQRKLKRKRDFKHTLSYVELGIPSLSRYYKNFKNIKHNKSWDSLMSNWSSSIPTNKIKCEYELSIIKPMFLSNKNEALVIITMYANIKETYTFDAFLFFLLSD